MPLVNIPKLVGGGAWGRLLGSAAYHASSDIGLLSSCCSESQREATLLLGQFAASDSDKVHIVQRGDVWPLIGMLQGPDDQLREMAAFALGRLAQISGPILNESQVRAIVNKLKQVIIASSSRKRARVERAKTEDFDAEEGELLKEENEQEEEVFDQARIKQLKSEELQYASLMMLLSNVANQL